ncbi:MAG: type II/IV secretion system protein, partial [Rhodanobacteraceae bacterium]
MAVNPQSRNPTVLLGSRGRLELDEVLAALIVDGLLSADDAKRVRGSDRSGKSSLELHPLVLIGNAKIP